MMNMVMTAAPLAMVDCNHSVTDATLGLQWHVIGMFLPSFFTGSLIVRYGAERVIAAGFVLLLASAAVSIAGITLWHFWGGLVLLGVGWNFGFIGATAMVTQCHRPHERNQVQSFNDFLVFGSMAIGSFASGNISGSVRLVGGERGRFPGGPGRRGDASLAYVARPSAGRVSPAISTG